MTWDRRRNEDNESSGNERVEPTAARGPQPSAPHRHPVEEEVPLEVSAGKGMRLTSMDAVVTKVPEGTLVHRASFFFSGGTDGPVLRTLHPRLEDGRRYRVEVRLSPTQPNESEGTADTLSREFLFQGQTSLRMNF